jgi:cellulose biosynthesis protein BcsS
MRCVRVWRVWSPQHSAWRPATHWRNRKNEDQDSHILAAFAPRGRPVRSRATFLEPARPTPTRSGQRFLLFATTDIWRKGGFAYGGALWAPSGLERDGPVLKLMFGGGLYQDNSGALGNVTVIGRELSAAILPGWRFVRDNVTVTVFLGYDRQADRLTPDDPSAGLRGGYNGVQTGFELRYQPTPWAMVAADASVSLTGPSYNVRLATGIRAFDAFYVGPEVQAFGADSNDRQLRAGLHVTGLRTGSVEWSAGAGFARDSDDHSGAYGKRGVLTRR